MNQGPNRKKGLNLKLTKAEIGPKEIARGMADPKKKGPPKAEWFQGTPTKIIRWPKWDRSKKGGIRKGITPQIERREWVKISEKKNKLKPTQGA